MSDPLGRGARLFARVASPQGVDCGGADSQESSATSTSAPSPSPRPQRAPSSCSYAAAAGAAEPAGGAPGCPVAPGQGAGTNPLNNIPALPNTPSASGLGTNRVVSSIPMTPPEKLPPHQQPGQQHWVYPSEQMFYSAMQRKGWDPQADDMRSVVAIHNSVNERAWREVMAWERLHCDSCPQGPRLKRFVGRPSDLSPKARLLNFLGYGQPFDRHDWVVDRCGQDVRYVIDFYNGVPQPGAAAAFFLDVRPALDSVGAAWDRLRMQLGWVASGRWLDNAIPSNLYNFVCGAEIVIYAAMADAAWSGDWSRIGVLTNDQEALVGTVLQLILAAHAVVGVVAARIAAQNGYPVAQAFVQGAAFGTLGLYDVYLRCEAERARQEA